MRSVLLDADGGPQPKHVFLKRKDAVHKAADISKLPPLSQHDNKGLTFAKKKGKPQVQISKRGSGIPPGGHSTLNIFSQSQPIDSPMKQRHQYRLEPIEDSRAQSRKQHDHDDFRNPKQEGQRNIPSRGDHYTDQGAEDFCYGRRQSNLSSNSFANGAHQNSGNGITDR
jgi:hypothetical protein